MTAPTLFNYAAAKVRRDRGAARAAEAQDNAVPGWGDHAYDAIVLVAKRQTTVFVDDVLKIFAVKPSHPNAWGAVWLRAIKANVIEHSGTVRPTTDARKNAHQYPVYRSLLKQ